MITLLPNGRACCPVSGLTPMQYRVLSQQPSQYFSEKERRFTFVPTPLGLTTLAREGIAISDANLSHEAARWHSFTTASRPRSKYGNVLNKDPWPHQDEAIDYAVHCPSPYMDMGMGTGKSLVTIGTLASCSHRLNLILCPKAVVNVWPREFRKHSRGDFVVVPLDQSSTKKKIEEARKWIRAEPTEKLVFVNNYESAIQKDFREWAQTIKWDAVIPDETHRIKSPTGEASKTCFSLQYHHPMGLSGTMLPHDVLDVWSQYRFLEPAIFGTSFTTFKKRYCELGYFNEVKKFVQLEELSEKINLIRHHVSGSVLGLPPVTHQEMRFELSPATKKAYDKFKKELIVEFAEGGMMSAANVLVRSVRLQQLTSGFFIDDNTSDVVQLDHRPKAAAFADWLDGVPRDKKAVVFCRFKHDIDIVKGIIEKDGRVYGELSGRRNDLTSDATFPPDVDVLAANLSSGGVGVDLTGASYGCYYSISHNRGEYDQSIARLNRPGQLDHVTFSHLIAEDTIDPEIYEAFEQGRDLVQAVLGGLRCSQK